MKSDFFKSSKAFTSLDKKKKNNTINQIKDNYVNILAELLHDLHKRDKVWQLLREKKDFRTDTTVIVSVPKTMCWVDFWVRSLSVCMWGGGVTDLEGSRNDNSPPSNRKGQLKVFYGETEIGLGGGGQIPLQCDRFFSGRKFGSLFSKTTFLPLLGPRQGVSFLSA